MVATIATSVLLGLSSAQAATTPSLGAAATFGVLGGTYTNTTVTTINGDIGYTTAPATAALGVHPGGVPAANTATARIDAGSALGILAANPCTENLGVIVDLSTVAGHPTGQYTPGVYCSTGAMSIGVGGITLNGSGTYIFRSVGALTSVAGSIVTLNGASACDVFWTPTAATTLAATTTFVGTIIDNANAITVGSTTTWSGRALSLGAGTVTTNTDTITAPVCAAAALSASSVNNTLTVIKNVINDNGGTSTIVDFPLFVNGKSVKNNEGLSLAPGTYTVSETNLPGYKGTFSGDCDVNGVVHHGGIDTHNDICILTNDDIGVPVALPPVPPLIDIVKVPDPLSLPAGPGLVKYTYTLRNVGTVPVTNISLVGDTCSPIVLVSGDTNGDNKLDLNETWVHTCSTTLTETHTNTVVATGWANGISTVDVASATVIVGVPVVPPLIHIVKIPNPLRLLSGGGMVKYTKIVTNPGTVPLNNVTLVDNKCNPVKFVSGDTNGDSKLDPSEKWVYTCSVNLFKTTTNTVIASGSANGLTVRDIAIATVVVAAPVPVVPKPVAPVVIPKLPKTGVDISDPTRIKIPTLNINTGIEKVGLSTDGSMAIPLHPMDTAWYQFGTRPGEVGNAVIAGHLNWYYGANGIFLNLNKLKAGDKITVSDQNGNDVSFIVRETKIFDAAADATSVFTSNDGKAHLNLVTCDGSWSKLAKQYTKRLVVFSDKE